MGALFIITLFATFPTFYQRQKLASIQNSHSSLLAEMKHSVSMLNANQTESDPHLAEVIDLLDKTIEKLEASDQKPMVFGIEVEEWNMRSSLASAFAIFGYWIWYDSGLNAPPLD